MGVGVWGVRGGWGGVYLFAGDGLCLRQHGPCDVLGAARGGQRAVVAVVVGSGG